MNASLRKIGALCVKDFKDLVKNPTTLITCLMPIAFLFFYNSVIGDQIGDDPEARASFSSFMLSFGLCMSAGMVGTMTVLYAIAEEKEKHTLRTLMLANVSAEQILASRGIVAMSAIAVVNLACYLIIEGPTGDLVTYMVIGLVGAVPIVLLSLLLGLVARDQMTAGLYSLPVVLLALSPLFGMYSEDINNVTQYLPAGGMDGLIRLWATQNLFTSDAIVAAATMLAWIVVGAVAFAALYKRLARDN